MDRKQMKDPIQRRAFLKNTSLAASGLAFGTLPVELSAYAGGSDIIKVGLVGSGGRGSGAAAQALQARKNVQLVAMSDVFEGQLENSLNSLKSLPEIKDQVMVKKENMYNSFSGYQQVIEASDVVILATPPGFRPLHFEAAIAANKHVFMEKPLSCDGPGTRQILATGKLATKKNLKVVVGLQNRYDPAYQEMVEKLQKGAIGDIKSADCYYLSREYAVVPRSDVDSELAYQIKNWHFFNWLWAGAPAGLQIHYTDIAHWAKQSYPVSAQGMGGRSVLEGPDSGEVFDHFYIEYTYADGSKMHSQIRTVNNAFRKNACEFVGTKGTANVMDGIISDKGKTIWKYENPDKPNPYQVEHDRFFEAIVEDKPINDTETGAHSTLAAILGRMACHSGQEVTWEEALNSDVDLAPDVIDWNSELPIKRNADGLYPVPIPGKSKVY